MSPGKVIHFKEIREYVQLAEKLGYNSAWAWEHIFLGTRSPFPVYDSLTLLPALAASTSKIRLGSSVIALPTRNPVIFAKNIATLDNIALGRLTLGISAGWYEKEFIASGVPFNQRGKIVETHLEILKKLWTESDVNGDYGQFKLQHVTLEPKPVQKPHPPVLMGGYVDAVLGRAGRVADGWLTYFYTPDSFRASWQKVLASAKESGRNGSGLRNADIVLGYVTNESETSILEAKEFISKTFDLPPWSHASIESALIGTKEECRTKLSKYFEAGVQEIIIIPLRYDMEQLELFSREIVPHFGK